MLRYYSIKWAFCSICILWFFEASWRSLTVKVANSSYRFISTSNMVIYEPELDQTSILSHFINYQQLGTLHRSHRRTWPSLHNRDSSRKFLWFDYIGAWGPSLLNRATEAWLTGWLAGCWPVGLPKWSQNGHENSRIPSGTPNSTCAEHTSNQQKY